MTSDKTRELRVSTGFVLLADKTTSDWMNENRHSEWLRYQDDPQIQKALGAYKPYEEALREAVKERGGKTIDEDYLHRAYDEYTEVGRSNPPPATNGR